MGNFCGKKDVPLDADDSDRYVLPLTYLLTHLLTYSLTYLLSLSPTQ